MERLLSALPEEELNCWESWDVARTTTVLLDKEALVATEVLILLIVSIFYVEQGGLMTK